MAKLGYARCSTTEQHLDLQIDALKGVGCEKIFTDLASGSRDDRTGLTELLQYARASDTVTIWRLDRFSRSLKSLIRMVGELEERKIGLLSITEAIDTTTPNGKFIFHLFGSLAEFERQLIKERVNAGLAAARSRGRVGGRPRLELSKTTAITVLAEKGLSVTEMCRSLGISRASYFRYRQSQREQALNLGENMKGQ